MPPFAFLVTNFPATMHADTSLRKIPRFSGKLHFYRFALIFILLVTF